MAPFGAGQLWSGSRRPLYAIPFLDRPALCSSSMPAFLARTVRRTGHKSGLSRDTLNPEGTDYLLLADDPHNIRSEKTGSKREMVRMAKDLLGPSLGRCGIDEVQGVKKEGEIVPVFGLKFCCMLKEE